MLELPSASCDQKNYDALFFHFFLIAPLLKEGDGAHFLSNIRYVLQDDLSVHSP
jgi:hypothetical protein